MFKSMSCSLLFLSSAAQCECIQSWKSASAFRVHNPQVSASASAHKRALHMVKDYFSMFYDVWKRYVLVIVTFLGCNSWLAQPIYLRA